MADRPRSEYRRSLADLTIPAPDLRPRAAREVSRDRLAALLLQAYRGTVDDEGETHDDAVDAVDHYLGVALADHANVLVDGDTPVALCCVSIVDGVHYIDPILVTPDRKRTGIGRGFVCWSLHRLRAAGVDEVGAAITDGNIPSERLFTGLGFTRIGPWPPVDR
ncbi:MAG: GNAT family N-acetyltransferase [Actinomycetota bacterium]